MKDEDALKDSSYSTIKWHGGGDVGELFQYSVYSTRFFLFRLPRLFVLGGTATKTGLPLHRRPP